MRRTDSINKIRLLLCLLTAGVMILSGCSILNTESINELIDNTDIIDDGTQIDSGESFELNQDGAENPKSEVIALPSEGRAEAEAGEVYVNEYDERAAGIIDDSIWAALDNLATVEYWDYSDEMTESTVQYPFERYCERMENRSETQSELFEFAYNKALNFEDFKVTDAEYDGDLIIDGLTIATDWDFYDPSLNNYFELDMMHGNDIYAGYFDPEKDANYPIEPGTPEFDDMRDKIKVFDAVVERVVRKMPEGLSTLDKYYYLACVISNKCHYTTQEETDSGAARNKNTAYGALINGSAVCEGYSKAFLLLCEEADLFCEIVSGIGGGEGHMWNLTQIETGTLNTDITWSDASEPGSVDWFDYFMMSDEELEYFDHIRTEGHAASSETIQK